MSEIQSEKSQEDIRTNTLEKEQELEVVDTKKDILQDRGNNSDEVIDEKIYEAIVAQVKSEMFMGPIPHPEILSGYEKVSPGSADRIIRMAEEQAHHRQELEKIKYKAESRDGLLGILAGFLLGASSIGGAIAIAAIVPTNAGAICGSIFGATGIGTMVVSFIKLTRTNKDNGK